jgi:hypothetical protein
MLNFPHLEPGKAAKQTMKKGITEPDTTISSNTKKQTKSRCNNKTSAEPKGIISGKQKRQKIQSQIHFVFFSSIFVATKQTKKPKVFSKSRICN